MNNQKHWERSPAYVFTDPFSNVQPGEIPADGAVCTALAGLNGDRHADLIVRTPNGIDPTTRALCPHRAEISRAPGGRETGYVEHIPDATPQISILSLNVSPQFLIPREAGP